MGTNMTYSLLMTIIMMTRMLSMLKTVFSKSLITITNMTSLMMMGRLLRKLMNFNHIFNHNNVKKMHYNVNHNNIKNNVNQIVNHNNMKMMYHINHNNMKMMSMTM